jgi:uncharacterized protein YegL
MENYKGEDMKEGLTELVFILDRSGSMSGMANEALNGFNSFLEEQKKLSGEANLTLVLFDHEYTLIHNGRNIKEVEPLTTSVYSARGTTALLDAVGRTMDDVGKRLSATPEENRPDKVLVAILTDGHENASKDYAKNKINEMILHQKDKYSWQFLFLAANQDAFTEGAKIGVNYNQSMNYTMDAAGFAKSFNTLNASAKVYRACSSVVFNNTNIGTLVDDDGKETKVVSDLLNNKN